MNQQQIEGLIKAMQSVEFAISDLDNLGRNFTRRADVVAWRNHLASVREHMRAILDLFEHD